MVGLGASDIEMYRLVDWLQSVASMEKLGRILLLPLPGQ
jgi:hypothetical protein